MMSERIFEFDQRGYLTPYDIVPTSWDGFVTMFGNTTRRRELLLVYESFLAVLITLLPIRHRHWIDGSFVSQKQEPEDIDIVVFVPHTHFTPIINELRQLKNDVKGSIDCYFVESFTPDHPKYEIGRADELDWYHFLRTDRQKRLKGSLELWVDYGNQ